MKILVLGGTGMAGHMIKDYLNSKEKYDVYYTCRDKTNQDGIFLEVTNLEEVAKLIHTMKPDVTINCTGILNQNAKDNPTLALQVNSMLPLRLAKLISQYDGKLIQISTDCVFSGVKGDYTESTIPDGTSIYSQTKQLGEIVSDNHLTIRTSIIGPELKKDGIGLFLWFMKQNGEIKGYQNALWNGVTTLELAKAIDKMIEHNVTGLFHLGSETKISKYDLLRQIQDVFAKNDVKIIPDKSVVIDRTLKNTRTDFLYKIPNYKTMLIELQDWMQH